MIGASGSNRRLLFLALMVWLMACTGYLISSSRNAGLGFPLDDAWIHQTYARNLSESLSWGFAPDNPSAGSTSPLWTGLISIGYFLSIRPLFWTLLLGLIVQVLLAFVCAAWVEARTPDRPGWIWAFALILLEWHLIWAALSGMEILLYSLLVSGLFLALSKLSAKPIWAGILIALGVWIRPDALLLLLPAGWVVLFRSRKRITSRLLGGVWMMIGFLILFIPYLMFNHALDGSFWPSTFYAKQAEYAVMRDLPLVRRLVDQLAQPLTGMGLILLPGVVWNIYQDVRCRDWVRLSPILWALAFLGAYALRLPVTYQHGRYAMPVIPVLIVLGTEGLINFRKPLSDGTWTKILARTWSVSLLAVGLVFLALGARAYGMDVAVIQTEMVQTSRWIAGHTEGDALVAAHDIGALGYFGDRSILDLAGLISPEVIPILRDEAALARLLNERGADYLMTFPGWYLDLTSGLTPVYISAGVYSPELGGENMVVYRWQP